MFRDPKPFFYSVLTLMVLVLAADWAAPSGDQGGTALAAECRAGYVYDGDTIKIHCGAKSERARLIGFDTPELTRPRCASERRAAEAARQALVAAIAAAESVEIVLKGRDKYRRRLIHLRLDGRDVAEMMIAAGHARPYQGGKRQGWCVETAGAQ